MDIFPSLWSVFCRTNSSRNYSEMVEPTESEQEQSSEGTTITAKAWNYMILSAMCDVLRFQIVNWDCSFLGWTPKILRSTFKNQSNLLNLFVQIADVVEIVSICAIEENFPGYLSVVISEVCFEPVSV